MYRKALFVLLLSISSVSVHAGGESITVFAGDTQGLINAIEHANSGTGPSLIKVAPGVNGESNFTFNTPINGGTSALPPIKGGFISVVPADENQGRITFRRAGNASSEFRLFEVGGSAELFFGTAGRNTVFNVEGFRVPEGDGGAVLTMNQGVFYGSGVNFSNNYAPGNGGAIAATAVSDVFLKNCELTNNHCGWAGGALSVQNSSTMRVLHSSLSNNQADRFGCDVNVNSATSNPVEGSFQAHQSIFRSHCGGTLFENAAGVMIFRNSTLGHTISVIHSTATANFLGNIFYNEQPGNQIQMDTTGSPRTEELCDKFGFGTFNSFGHNIAPDESCGLDQPTDLPSVNPMIASDANGLPAPQPGSPAIDSGPIEALVWAGETLASLPCGYRDITGTGRPQDANGDGVFECDRGAIEVPGGGVISSSHSAVFFNPQRSGEGNYVEILEDGTAVIYTFTYNPAGDGPAWFVGVGEYSGNSIILDEIYRPVGATFGEAFDINDIDLTPAGSMSMVFPDCRASAPGGNIAYTGDESLGYEGLITRATRLAHITGCGTEVPHANAGLSGSWYDPARSGEGLIVEWITNGDVLAVFFTYDPDGNQFWLAGQAAAIGDSVTMAVLYPTSFTPWGRNFDADEIALGNWGTFTLTWTDCNTMTFEYDSTVPGFDSGSRNYTRLSKLNGTTCPQ